MRTWSKRSRPRRKKTSNSLLLGVPPVRSEERAGFFIAAGQQLYRTKIQFPLTKFPPPRNVSTMTLLLKIALALLSGLVMTALL